VISGATALESGLVRSKNSIYVAIENFANFLVAASLFLLFGFGFMLPPCLVDLCAFGALVDLFLEMP
jgi:ammonia channel protein AmtB